jgi:hypothetical protein
MKIVSDEPRALTHPELIFGIAGPIGIDINAIAEELERALDDVGYTARIVRVTDDMMRYPAAGVTSGGIDHFSTMMYKMDYANRLCEEARDPARLMRIAIQAIGLIRF